MKVMASPDHAIIDVDFDIEDKNGEGIRDITTDIIIEILMRVDVKLLVRSMCVSKDWHELVKTNPRLMSSVPARPRPRSCRALFWFEFSIERERKKEHDSCTLGTAMLASLSTFWERPVPDHWLEIGNMLDTAYAR
ncbi:hypothetical protein Droror1_Dr00003176 [Drosera rotundifolia]